VTSVKVDSKLGGNASISLESHVSRLYHNPGMRIVGVVELAHVERTQPAPEEDKEASVKLAVKHLEIANSDQEDHLRQAMRALYLHRTAQGKLDEAGEIELAEGTVRMTAGMLNAVEAARLRVALKHWVDYAEQAQRSDLTVTQAMKELDTLAKGMRAALAGVPETLDF
jgi:hypothetical protein